MNIKRITQADINGLQLRMKYGYTTSLSSPIILDPGSTPNNILPMHLTATSS